MLGYSQLGAAMVHEFHWLLPTLALEKNDSPVAALLEIVADPSLGSVWCLLFT